MMAIDATVHRHKRVLCTRYTKCMHETWSLKLRKERRLRVLDNRVLIRLFVPKRDEVTGEWRKLHIKEHNDLGASPSIVRVIKSRTMRWAGHGARRGKGRVL
jgi:hypothetical protein